MSYDARSKILEAILIELRKKSVTIPENVMSDLKSARVLVKVMDASQSDLRETAPKIEEYLGTVEAYLITEAQKHFASEKVDEWLRFLDQKMSGYCSSCASVEVDKPEKENRFITGVPRDQKWIRVEPLPSLSLEKLEELATQTNLGFREEKGQLIVYGQPDDIKAFVKKMTAQASKQ